MINRRPPIALACILLALTAVAEPTADAAPAATRPRESLVVLTDNGAVRGQLGDRVREFKGIPFAAPPLGALRWEVPVAARPWRGELDATRYRSACPQPSRYGLTDASDDEDCLYLNVTVPTATARTGGKRPVFVWIHGGAFIGGSSNLYPLDYLARRGDMVVVSINYRLGVFGFMPHPAFAPDYNGGYALEDQRAALRWVQRNIRAFGGDPRNVTIAGESAGAASVCMQLFAPAEAAGLFRKAVVQSAACVVPLRTAVEANAIGVRVAALVGCAEPTTALGCLRSKSVAELLDAATTAGAGELLAYAPTTGTRALPMGGSVALASGKFVRVPILNGGNRDEMRLYVGYDVAAGHGVTTANYADKLKAIYGDQAPEVLAEYPAANYSSAPSALGTAMSDYMPGGGLSNCLYLRTAELAARFVPVFEYEFADRDAPPEMPDPGFELGAVHAAELPYQFPHISHTYKVDGPDLAPAAQRLADQMSEYWAAFARTGQPSPVALPHWPRFVSARAVMRFEPGHVRPFNADAAHHCGFWRRLYPAVLGDRRSP